MKVCTIEGCGKTEQARGWCGAHYALWKRNGSPLARQRGIRGLGCIAPNGYLIVGDCSEHVAVATKALGKPLPPGAIVHHVNENKLDNRPENLVICPGNEYHFLLHRRMDALAACGNADWRRCMYCKKYDAPANLRIWRNVYHAECGARHMREFRANKRSASA